MHYRTSFTIFVFSVLCFTINRAESTPQTAISSTAISTESSCTRCSIQSTVSKTIDFVLLFGTATGVICAGIVRCMDDYQSNENAHDSVSGALLMSTLCATAYVIKKKCI